MLDFLTTLTAMPVSQLIAGAGFACLIAGFAGLQFGMLDGNGNGYAVMNIAGALLVLLGLASSFGFALGLFVISWIFLGLAGLIIRFFRDWGATMKSIEQPKGG